MYFTRPRLATRRARWTGAWLVTVIAMSGSPTRLWAGVNAWTGIGPNGAQVRAVTIDPHDPATLYAGTNGQGVFVSTDGGQHWASTGGEVGFGVVYEIIAAPTAATTLYALADAPFDGSIYSTIFQSTDRGRSWTLLNVATGALVTLTVDPAAPEVLYAATSAEGLLKSTDAGATWSTLGNGLASPAVRGVTIHTTFPLPAVVYAATLDGVFKSTDGGASWAAFNNGLPPLVAVRKVVVDPFQCDTVYAGTINDGLFKSTDAGGHWEAINNGLANRNVVRLVVDPQNTSTLYATVASATSENEPGALVISHDAGATWTVIDPGGGPVHDIVAVADAAGRLYAGTLYGGIRKSTDGGTTWSESNTGLSNVQARAVVLAPTSPPTLYTAILGGIVKTTDDGASWVTINEGLSDLNATGLTIDPANPAAIYAVAGSQLLRSTDSGASWALTSLRASIDAVAVDPVTPTTLYAGDESVYKSTDGGATWSDGRSNLPNHAAVRALAVDPHQPSTVLAATEGQPPVFPVHRSTDGGASWRPTNTGFVGAALLSLVIDPVTPGIAYAGAEVGVLRSTDGGVTWSATGLRNVFVVNLAIDAASPSTLYAATSTGIFKTSDSGQTWRALNAKLRSTPTSVVVDPSNSQRLYAATESAGVFVLLQNGMPATVCAGDCDGSGTVAIDDILTMVRIAESGLEANGCFAGDVNNDDAITIDEVLVAVGRALSGCVE